MIDLYVDDIAGIVQGELDLCGPGGSLLRGISIDSRTIKPGELFVAVAGEKTDGHKYIAEALEKGASGVVSERSREELAIPGRASGNYHFIRVRDSIAAMESIAVHIRKQVDIPIVAVTGTNGKTTVKDMLHTLLSIRYRVLKSPRSYNNRIGVCLSLFQLDRSCQVAVLEVGTNHPGEIAYLARIIRPMYAVITNIGPGHLAFFGDMDSVFKEKSSLLGSISENGAVFLNGDDERLRAILPGRFKMVFFGESEGCDNRVSCIRRERGGYGFLLNGEPMYLPFAGEHNVSNAAAASSVAFSMGIGYNHIREALLNVSLPDMRLDTVREKGVLFLNDAYNANPASFECALTELSKVETGGRKWVVAGDMMELGEHSDRYHRELGTLIASCGMDFLMVMGSRAGEVVAGAVVGGMDQSRIFNPKSHMEAAIILKDLARPEDVVLLKGSRKMRMEEIIQCFTTSYTR